MTTVVKILSRRTSEKCHSDTDDIDIQYESHKVHSLRGAFAFLAIDTTLMFICLNELLGILIKPGEICLKMHSCFLTIHFNLKVSVCVVGHTGNLDLRMVSLCSYPAEL